MIVCEYFFKEFNTHGSGEYLIAWCVEVDLLAAHGWQVLAFTQKARSE